MRGLDPTPGSAFRNKAGDDEGRGPRPVVPLLSQAGTAWQWPMKSRHYSAVATAAGLGEGTWAEGHCPS